MPEVSSIAPVGVIVLLAIVAGLVAFRLSERSQRRTSPDQAPALPVDDDMAGVLAALRSTTILLAADDEVLRASASAHALGLLRHGRLTHASIADLVAEARREGGVREVAMTVPRGPGIGSGHLSLDVRVAALSGSRVLVLADDRTAARRLDEVRRDFVANVSHELKTPVGAIALLAETIGDAAGDPDAVRRFSEQMGRESRRLSELVQDIIDLSRLQEPDALLNSAAVDLDAVVAESVDRARVEARARDVGIAVGGRQGLKVFGDHALLVTALRNLLDNALRYSDRGTRVSIGVDTADDGMVEIAVVDQGVGISADELPRVFERFYRIDPARSRETGGTGLGLSIVKHVAADHGGEVRVWSTPGRGSTFTLRIPVADRPPGEGPGDEPPDEVRIIPR
ncbi:histidine kinase [Beutenbergia cavernae DSM 12333]|uniref:Sensor-like histidine kinase SenX3 n=1 Tax=Beutenbergia cavernae (strain ATCC BAA-8 / DSM 12333 / CCUG 43141 / JCM 11478 / NBRC 16432 / NCIMB 13614 / HKI 0122) TaxID=471853 RepID=C5BYS3_BEUC1|nr:ATP-binding protein [Beutenbergia cavernae]ACQ79031.1 histidine kinase [Beutenbergia cavernae DSM 12333]